jgi:prepilin-type N-terminal cleavage/methylation domain-containing protein
MTNERKGFTLIEILIVVAIIAILASVVLVGLGPTQQAGRDARRLSDIHEVQNGLELYYNKCGFYPGSAAAAACGAANNAATTGYSAGATSLNAALTGSGLQITTVPLDPTNATPHLYFFKTNGATASTYLLATVLENTNNSIFTGYTPLTAAQVSSYGSGDNLTPAGVGTACNAPEYCLTI